MHSLLDVRGREHFRVKPARPNGRVADDDVTERVRGCGMVRVDSKPTNHA